MIIYRFIYCIQLEGCLLDRPWDLRPTPLAAVSVPSPHDHGVTRHGPPSPSSDTLCGRIMICSDLVFNYIPTRRWGDAHQQHASVWAASTDRWFTSPGITCHYHHLRSSLTILSTVTDSTSMFIDSRCTIWLDRRDLCFYCVIYFIYRQTVGPVMM